ncbi:hypothetical protein [Brevibacterium jeotgali]|nr:hypothetical protein [Brevibacterium jeotgali]
MAQEAPMNALQELGGTAEAALERLNADPEFTLKARKWEGRFKVVRGNDTVVIQMHEGAVDRIEVDPTIFTAADFTIAASKEEWDRLLVREPAPFYQDIYSAWLHHGFTVDGDLEQFFGFHMALRRLQQMLRGIE